MAMQITQWSPDTCGCTMQYSWDDSVPVEERTLTAHQTVKLCEFHTHDNVTDHFDALLKENQGKNLAVGVLLANLPEEYVECSRNEHGQDVKKFVEEPKWSFDEDRNVILEHPALTEEIAQLISSQVEKLK